MNIVQALEGFHRRFRSNKRNDLAKRIRELYNEFSQINLIKNIFDPVDDIIDSTCDSRHYYSHFYKRESDKTKEGKELYDITIKLKVLLTCCILKEVGFDDITINMAITEEKLT